MEQLTVYATTAETGYLHKEGIFPVDWDATHDAPLATYGYENISFGYVCAYYTGAPIYYRCGRGRVRFDTSELPDICIIPSATLSLMIKGVVNKGAGHKLLLVSGEGLGDTLEVSDYGTLLGNTAPMDSAVALGDLTLEEYVDFALNSEALALISKTGYTKFGVRVSQDVDDLEPIDYVLESAVDIYWGGAPAGKKPKLVINYAFAAGRSQAYIM